MEGRMNMSEFWKNINTYYKRYGLHATIVRIMDKLTGQSRVDYMTWYQKTKPTKQVLKIQRETTFPYMPEILVIVLENKSGSHRLADSLKNQTYSRWKLCKIRELNDVVEILKEAKEEYVLITQPEDELSADAFFQCVKSLNADRTIEAIYSDDDIIKNETEYEEPAIKPDLNLDMLRSCNYIHNFLLVKKKLCQELFEECLESWNGQIDWKYDFIFRCIEEKHSIHHIAKVLYHRNVEHVQVCDEQERKAIDMHLKRMNIKGNVEKTEYRGIYRVRYTMEETPLISIVIPNKDHVEDLKKCIDSLEKKSSYDNREYIIVENNSTEEQTFAYYKELEAKCPRAKVVYWKEKGFNYPKINNYGVQYAKGEYILFLNNDTEIQNPDCLEEMLIHCSRPEVGAVGARLFYEDGTIQHVGVIVGLGGIAGHPYAAEAEETLGHMGRVHMIQDLSAVTAACMMVKKTVFFEVGKFEPEYAVAFNDVDLCMKIRKAGYLIVYTPYARLTHYESKSRGLEDSREKVKRFDSEVALFEECWGKELEKGDPNYNPNFRLDEKDFRLNVHVRR